MSRRQGINGGGPIKEIACKKQSVVSMAEGAPDAL